MPSFLAASVNGRNTDEVATFWQRDGIWQAEPAQWQKLGIVLKGAEQSESVIGADVLGIELAINEADQTVDLAVPVDRLPTQSLGKQRSMPKLSAVAPGVLVNYNLAGRFSRDSQAISAGHEIRTGGRWGMLSSTGQVNWTDHGGAAYVRGQTRWQFDDYGRQISYQVGDIASGPDHASLGGVRIAKDPSLDPYTPTYPVPSIGGVALDAATIEILANQSKVAEHDVQKGAFTVERFPLRPGNNAMDVVVRDEFGRQQIISSQQLYFSPQLLRPGLTTWSVSAGAVRQGITDTYGKTGASLQVARGLSDTWTVSGSAQTDGDNHNAIAGARTVLGTVGVVDVQVGQSSGEQGTGNLLRASYSYTGQNFGVSVSHERADNFWELSTNDAQLLRASRRTQAGVSWNSDDRRWRARLSAVDLNTAFNGREQKIRYADASVGYRHGRHALTGSVLFDFERQAPTVALGYNYQFGRSGIAATATQAPDISRMSLSGNTTVELAGNPLALRGEIADRDGARQTRVSADARFEKGRARVEVSNGFGETQFSTEVSGAVHIGRGGVSWLPRVATSYAVVEVPGVEGVPIRAGGREIGKTNSAGRLVIPNLMPLTEAKIRVDDKALPPGVQLESSELTVAPRRMSGARATFKVLAHNARAFTVHRATPIEPGTMAKSETEETMIGFDGALYLENPEAGQKLTITDAAGTCAVVLPDQLPAWNEQPVLECQ